MDGSATTNRCGSRPFFWPSRCSGGGEPRARGCSDVSAVTPPRAVVADTTTFHCPRCGGDYPRAYLERCWSEWGRVCVCTTTGTINPHCRAMEEPQRVQAGRLSAQPE